MIVKDSIIDDSIHKKFKIATIVIAMHAVPGWSPCSLPKYILYAKHTFSTNGTSSVIVESCTKP